MSVGLINYKEDVGFIGTIDPLFNFWLPISNTTYSTLFCDPNNEALTYAYYLNKEFDAKLMFLYSKATFM